MSRLPPEFLDEIKHRLPVSTVVISRGVKIRKAGAEWKGLSPFNAEKTPSFCVNDRKQAWFDFSSGKNGNIFDFLMQTTGVSFPQAVEILAAEAGLTMPPGWGKKDWVSDPTYKAKMAAQRAESERRRTRMDADQNQRKKTAREAAHDIWKATRPIAGTLGERYLALRGIEFAAGFRTLRFHDGLEHFGDDGKRTVWPGIVGALQAPDDGRFLAVWRILLSDATDNLKAPKEIVGGKAKFGRGSFAEYGGSVRLGAVTETANVCEGIESGCGIYGIKRMREGVQAATSTAGMVAFIPPKGCKRVRIWPDGDTDRFFDKLDNEKFTESPGMVAAQKLHDRLKQEGWDVEIVPTFKNGLDFLDVWNRGRTNLNASHQDKNESRSNGM